MIIWTGTAGLCATRNQTDTPQHQQTIPWLQGPAGPRAAPAQAGPLQAPAFLRARSLWRRALTQTRSHGPGLKLATSCLQGADVTAPSCTQGLQQPPAQPRPWRGPHQQARLPPQLPFVGMWATPPGWAPWGESAAAPAPRVRELLGYLGVHGLPSCSDPAPAVLPGPVLGAPQCCRRFWTGSPLPGRLLSLSSTTASGRPERQRVLQPAGTSGPHCPSQCPEAPTEYHGVCCRALESPQGVLVATGAPDSANSGLRGAGGTWGRMSRPLRSLGHTSCSVSTLLCAQGSHGDPVWCWRLHQGWARARPVPSAYAISPAPFKDLLSCWGTGLTWTL